MKQTGYRFDTKVVNAGAAHRRIEGAVNTPIFQTANFLFSGESDYHDIRYTRLSNNPNQLILGAKLAQLENAEAALVMASGMAAISTALLTVLSSGDHVLFQDTLYGGTHNFVTEDLPKYGIQFDFIDATAPESWDGAVRPNTRAIYVEAMTNPLLQVIDLAAVTHFARRHHLVSLIDNTFPSPANFRPAEWGFDISLHSCTKYLNGHSDIIAGAVIGRADLVEKITHKTNHLGGCLDPHSCFLLERGIKTLGLRMRQHNASALKIARFLSEHPAVAQVNYPGLQTHPQHQLAKKFFAGYSGMMSFELKGGLPAAERFIDRLTLPLNAPSLGGVETLITRPAATSHVGMSRADREKAGIRDGLIRLSVGIEDPQDLIEDMQNALEG